MKKITDKKVLDLLKKVNDGDEDAINKLLEALVCVLLDIRTSVKKDSCKVYNKPTDNPHDIIVGKEFDAIPEQEIIKGGLF